MCSPSGEFSCSFKWEWFPRFFILLILFSYCKIRESNYCILVGLFQSARTHGYFMSSYYLFLGCCLCFQGGGGSRQCLVAGPSAAATPVVTGVSGKLSHGILNGGGPCQPLESKMAVAVWTHPHNPGKEDPCCLRVHACAEKEVPMVVPHPFSLTPQQ